MLTETNYDAPFHSYIETNHKWAASLSETCPKLLPTLATGQRPPLLWIGCADSRCPETTFLNAQPGSVFTHRNIANIVHPSDLSLTAVLEYGIRHLKVRHLVLCGHTSCGGAAAALADTTLGVLDPWLLPLRLLAKEKHAELEACKDASQKAALLVELNVRKGIETLMAMFCVREAVASGQIDVHGLVYDISTGKLREIDCASEIKSAVGKPPGK